MTFKLTHVFSEVHSGFYSKTPHGQGFQKNFINTYIRKFQRITREISIQILGGISGAMLKVSNFIGNPQKFLKKLMIQF